MFRARDMQRTERGERWLTLKERNYNVSFLYSAQKGITQSACWELSLENSANYEMQKGRKATSSFTLTKHVCSLR